MARSYTQSGNNRQLAGQLSKTQHRWIVCRLIFKANEIRRAPFLKRTDSEIIRFDVEPRG